ncbi:hypothetical protein AVL59_26685 [Streptomyces griseochromogenes]|uniref:Uncharacterized protein n=1 Tax=Streptomyces griseochromogenes TaxID=68214 RepID=A0A1B1B1F5_9ACTN|nr:hypothetical protein AVL59_26685 [Streptomyces griseochromogenes]
MAQYRLVPTPRHALVAGALPVEQGRYGAAVVGPDETEGGVLRPEGGYAGAAGPVEVHLGRDVVGRPVGRGAERVLVRRGRRVRGARPPLGLAGPVGGARQVCRRPPRRVGAARPA